MSSSMELTVDGETFVFFDLETTGLERDCDIVQIAACCGRKCFMQYVIPEKSIDPGASAVTGITFVDGLLYHNEEAVDAINAPLALSNFCQFIHHCAEKVVLLAHNGARFDFPRLRRQMADCNISLPPNVCHFLDTLPVMKDLYPGRQTYRQVALVTDLLGSTYGAHDAAEDSAILQELMRHAFDDQLSTAPSIARKHLLRAQDVFKIHQSPKPSPVKGGCKAVRTAAAAATTKHLDDGKAERLKNMAQKQRENAELVDLSSLTLTSIHSASGKVDEQDSNSADVEGIGALWTSSGGTSGHGLVERNETSASTEKFARTDEVEISTSGTDVDVERESIDDRVPAVCCDHVVLATEITKSASSLDQPLTVRQGSLVFLDIDTTGFEADCDIVRISACCGHESIAVYATPRQPINKKASEVNGLTFSDGHLHSDGKAVAAVSAKQALTEFAQFTERCGSAVVLTAHNGCRFDFTRLLRQMNREKVELPGNVSCFLDSLSLMKSLYRGRSSYGRDELIRDLIGLDASATDASALQSLLSLAFSDHAVISRPELVEKHLISLEDMIAKAASFTTSRQSLPLQMENLRLDD